MGGYGGMYGGMGGMGGMYGGMPGDPNDPNSLTNSFSQSTQATFQMIESIVGAFGGFAQMLESTYMATHSSFFGTLTSFPRRVVACSLIVVPSHGLCGRAVRKPPKHAWLRPRYLHHHPLVQDSDREDHRSSPAG